MAYANSIQAPSYRLPVEEIFIVDDDVDLCEVITWSLEAEGYRVRTFGSGETALRSLLEFRPPLIILDFHLGDMDGQEFLKRKRELDCTSPVIIVSGSPDEVLGNAPRVDYASLVEKPLDLPRLLREIGKLNVPCSPKSSNEASTQPSHGPAFAG